MNIDSISKTEGYQKRTSEVKGEGGAAIRNLPG